MIRILFAGREMTSIPAFTSALDQNDIQLTYIDSGQKALEAVASQRFDLLIADEKLGDMTGLELIEGVITQNPMLNCAALSSLAPDEFHEASEGLGVLMRLSIEPDQNEVDQLLAHLKKIQSFTQSSRPKGSC